MQDEGTGNCEDDVTPATCKSTGVQGGPDLPLGFEGEDSPSRWAGPGPPVSSGVVSSRQQRGSVAALAGKAGRWDRAMLDPPRRVTWEDLHATRCQVTDGARCLAGVLCVLLVSLLRPPQPPPPAPCVRRLPGKGTHRPPCPVASGTDWPGGPAGSRQWRGEGGVCSPCSLSCSIAVAVLL